LRAAGDAVTHNLDLLDARRIQVECSLDADAAAHGAHGHRTGDAAAAQAHDGAFEKLAALAVAFLDLDGNTHGVAGGEGGQVGPDLVGGNFVDDGHGRASLVAVTR